MSRSETDGSSIKSITLPRDPDLIRALSASLDIVDVISVPEKGMVVTKIRICSNYGLFIGCFVAQYIIFYALLHSVSIQAHEVDSATEIHAKPVKRI